MNEAVVKEKLLELSDIIKATTVVDQDNALGFEGIYVAAGSKVGIPEVIDQLRMQIKYLSFDLEASQRENRYLRQMLEMRPPKRQGGKNDEPDPNSSGGGNAGGWR